MISTDRTEQGSIDAAVGKPVDVEYGNHEKYHGVLRQRGDEEYVLMSNNTGREKIIHELRSRARIYYNDGKSPFTKVVRF